jgi:hypothetical protein
VIVKTLWNRLIGFSERRPVTDAAIRVLAGVLGVVIALIILSARSDYIWTSAVAWLVFGGLLESWRYYRRVAKLRS